MDYIGISFVETDGQVFLRGQPNAVRPAMDTSVVHTMLVEFGAEGCEFDEKAIAVATEYCNSRQDPFVVQVAQRLNAQITVKIAADEMWAEVDIAPAKGGTNATVEDAAYALTQAGVVFGVDDEALHLACATGIANHVVVARGVLPEDGHDSVFTELIPKTADRAPKVDENGLIDYRETGAITAVNVGMALMRRTPATPGVEGHTVRGRPLPARPGRDDPFPAQLAGTQIAKDDPNLLQAAVSGLPVRVTNGVMVEPIFQVGEVNMATGNIHFDGTVQIKGDVVQGMKVQAKGDIVVAGMVDGGTLEAGGDIKIAGGVIAHAKLRAQGAVSARFAQSAQIRAGTVIAISDMAMDCELLSLNQIIIGADSHGRGRMIGGTATAMMLMSVPVLGSAKSAVTKVVLGANFELTEQYEALQQRILKEKEAEEHLEKLVKQVTASGDPKGMLPRIKASRQNAIQVWGKSLAERKELEAKMALTLGAKMQVTGSVAGAVDLMFCSHPARLRRELGAGSFTLDAEEHIIFTDSRGQTTVLG